MTQALTRPTLPLQLVSMRLPETVDWIRRPRSQAATEPDPNVLQLTPGMVGEIDLELENSGTHAIEWSLELTGNFPVDWCLPSSTEQETGDGAATPSPVPPGHHPAHQLSGTIQQRTTLHHSIRLRVPDDFFERQAALLHQPALELNYDGEIFLFAHWQGRQRLAGYQSLRIEVRPVCDYMTLLPEIFHSEDFMARFLSVFEQTFDPSLQMLRMLRGYLDPLTAPRTLLPFLSKWVAWELEPRWSLKQQRRLIRYAVELYRWRGTRRGLLYYLHLYTDLPLDEGLPEAEKHISITDETQNAFVFGQAKFGELAATDAATADERPFAFGGGKPFHFKVVLRPDRPNPIDESLVRQVIEQVKPAFCTYDLNIDYPQAARSETGVREPQAQPS
ncbi:MAG: phage tail protein [Synechococcales bacterium]|nr:phage tail protein [Synechococcales bacterium]